MLTSQYKVNFNLILNILITLPIYAILLLASSFINKVYILENFIKVYFTLNFVVFPVQITFTFDHISFFFIIILLFGIGFAIFSERFFYQNFMHLDKLLMIYLIGISLFFAFTTQNILFFFFFFESILIPISYLIIKYGSFKKNQKAVLYLVTYTFIGSLFFIIAITLIYLEYNTLNFELIECLNSIISFNNNSKIIWLCLFFAFLIKVPSYPFHV